MDCATIRFSLVGKHLSKRPKAHITDGASKMVIADHAHDMEVFNDHLGIGLRQGRGELVERISTDGAYMGVEPSQFPFCLVPMGGELHSSGEFPIETAQLFQCRLEWLGTVNRFPRRKRCEMCHAQIDPHPPCLVFTEGECLDLDAQTDMPAIRSARD